MAKFILIKKKGQKRWIGAIPVRKGVTKVKLQKSLKKGLKSGLTYRVTDGAGVKRVIKSVSLRRKRRKKK